jgi:hypothetical protein
MTLGTEEVALRHLVQGWREAVRMKRQITPVAQQQILLIVVTCTNKTTTTTTNQHQSKERER